MVLFGSKLNNPVHPTMIVLNSVLFLLPMSWPMISAVQGKDQALSFIIFVQHDHAVSTWGIKSDRFKEINPTPNIDNLGKTGYSFINAFCSNGSSSPVRSTLLTGKFAHQHGLLLNGNRFDPKDNAFQNPEPSKVDVGGDQPKKTKTDTYNQGGVEGSNSGLNIT